MQLSHTSRATSAVFDDPNLVSAAGLVPVLALARSAGLHELAQRHLSVRLTRVRSGVEGCLAGSGDGRRDSIDDMALLRHGGMGLEVGEPVGHALLVLEPLLGTRRRRSHGLAVPSFARSI